LTYSNGGLLLLPVVLPVGRVGEAELKLPAGGIPLIELIEMKF
jgi:hypothetical protein